MRTNRLLPWLGCVLLTAAAGCRPAQSPGAGAAELPVIPVSQPVVREVRDYEDFTGQTDAVQVVDIRARVTGYLNKMPFKEGSEVKEGDLLFEIDARPYQAQLDQAVAQVASNEEL
jgi:membrane fusion protein, multidrug efflux system